MAFRLAGGLSKPDWCRLELYGWPWHSALVSEHWIGRGMDFWGSEIWTIADVLMRKTSTTFLDCFVFPGRTGKHVLDIGVFKKDCFSLWSSHLVRGWNQTLKRLGSRIDILISDLAVLPFGHSRRVWRWDKKKLEVIRMVVSLFLMLQWATIS